MLQKGKSMAIKISSGDRVLVYFEVSVASVHFTDAMHIVGWLWGRHHRSNFPVIKIKAWRSKLFRVLHEN